MFYNIIKDQELESKTRIRYDLDWKKLKNASFAEGCRAVNTLKNRYKSCISIVI